MANILIACESITKNRAVVRSKTFPGIANAIVNQWGGLING